MYLRHTFTTRLLYTAMASKSYTPTSLDALHKGMATDLNRLFTSGLSLDTGGKNPTIFAACVGGKGDWPYVRKAFGLSTGFQCTRVCHMCGTHVTCTQLRKFSGYPRCFDFVESYRGSLRLCPLAPKTLQDWWQVGKDCPTRSWTCTNGPSPFKAGQGGPMRSIVGLNAPHRARPDQMHVYAYGYGKDFAASAIMLCCRMGVWPASSYQVRPDKGYESFRSWCSRMKKSTSLTGFNPKCFKMGQLHARI